MKNQTKKLLATVLTVVMFICGLPFGAFIVESSAANISETQFANKITQLKSVYRQGEYWNEYNSCKSNGTGPIRCSGSAEGVACTTRGYCGGSTGAGCTCTCGAYYENGVAMAWQCMGFAHKMGYEVFGDYISSSAWETSYSLGTIYAGDIIRIKNQHSIFVIKVVGETVYYADCNRSGPCQVDWSGSYTKSQIASFFNYKKHYKGNTLTGTGAGDSISYSSISTGYYTLTNVGSGKILDVAGGVDADKTNIQGGDWWNPSNQRLYISPATTGYKMKPVCSSRLVNAWGDNPENGANVNIYKDCNESSQWWLFEKVNDGYVIHLAYNPSLVLTYWETSNNVAVATYASGDTRQIWKLDPSNLFTVSYNANGGSGAPAAQTMYQGRETALSSAVPARSEYIFEGWNTKADGTGVPYRPGDTYIANANVTLYAIWVPDCEHEYVTEITQQPTCTEKGIKTYTCSVCNDVYYEDIDELGHDYVACVTEPTCTEQGFTTYECSRCGDTYTENYIDPLNHSSSSWHTAINPTATSEGLAEKRCDYCDTVLEQFTIPCLAPDYVTGITLSSDKETVKIGDSFTLSATVIPDTAKNKNVIWSSRNPEIASVDNGKVTANKPGTTAIVAETEDGGYIDFCLVRVVSLVSFNGAVVDNEKNIIYGLSSNLANVDDYLKTADDSMSITFSTATVGTGTFINVMDNGEVIDLYEAVIFGDVNGDGWYDGQDAVLVSCLANGMLTEADVSESVFMAADCNHDGVIDEKDVEILNEAGTLLANVDQSKPEEVLLETSAEYVEYLELINQSPELEVEDETDIPEEDVETEETIPEQNAEFDFFEMIMNFIKLVIEAIRSYIPALYK